jgi:16S rRNA (guanine966-N2)-methyltransferase
VHATAVQTYLRTAGRAVDVVFLDPPYDLPAEQLNEDLVLLRSLLVDDALVIVERATRSGAPAWGAAGLREVRSKRFGDTTLWWGEPDV